MNRRELFYTVPLFLAKGRAQDPLRTLPQNYRLVLENAFVRVIRVHYAPHEKLPVHNHSEKPTVYVYLTDSGPVRFSHVEQKRLRAGAAATRSR